MRQNPESVLAARLEACASRTSTEDDESAEESLKFWSCAETENSGHVWPCAEAEKKAATPLT